MYETYPKKTQHKKFGSTTIGSLPGESKEMHDQPCGGAKAGGNAQVSARYPKKTAHSKFKEGLPS
ncbi:MAG: hypothetical protein R3260_03515 [Pseudomonas sp.]|nr:hypothetical protein [Pseudomonas sp.]